MGLFSGSKSKTVSTTDSFDRSDASSASGGFSVSGSDQRIAFEDVFARLFGGAEGAAGGLDPSLLTEASNYLFGAGTDFIEGLRDNAGISYMEDRLNRPSELIDEQIGLLQEDIGRLFSEELNPAITDTAIAGGQLGGGRQGVAQGRALDIAADQFTRGATALRAGDVASRDALAGQLSQAAIGGAQTGLAGMTNLAAIADLGFGAGLSPYERLAGILGPMQTLTSAGSTAADFARSISSSYGRSTGRSVSKSKSLGIG